ncbi:hypothetical protein D3C87_1693540 [compost metagenome]
MLDDRHAEGGPYSISGDVVMGRPDAAGREDVIISPAQDVERPDDLILPVANRSRLHQVDPQGRQKTGDGVQVHVPGPTGQDFVADDQNGGGGGGVISHALQIGAAFRRVIVTA